MDKQVANKSKCNGRTMLIYKGINFNIL